MTPVTTVGVVKLDRQYPHVEGIPEWATQQSVRLLWDRVFQLQEQLTAANATIALLVSSSNLNETDLATAQAGVNEALALAQRVGQPAESEGPGGGGEELPGGGDGGQGQVGCAAAGANGHDTGGLLDPVRAGQLVCGTGNEFPALKNATATIEERDDNAEELMRRAIWHLRQGGFDAGRQQNPSGLLSRDKLCVVVDGVLRAYDIFLGKGNFSVAMSTHMHEVGPAVLVDDEGIPD